MTISINLPEAANQFTELLSLVRQGEEVIISEAGVEIARLIPTSHQRKPRTPGQDAGKVIMAPDFNAPLPAHILNDFLNSSAF